MAQKQRDDRDRITLDPEDKSSPDNPRGDKKDSSGNRPRFSVWIYLAIFLALLVHFFIVMSGAEPNEVEYSQFLDYVEDGYVEEILIVNDTEIRGQYTEAALEEGVVPRNETEQPEILGGETDPRAFVTTRAADLGLYLAAMAAFALESEVFGFSEGERAALTAQIAEAPIHRRYGWSADQRRRFARLCRSEAMANAYWKGAGDLDHWLTLGFGEFCYAAMPELDPEMAARLKAFQTKAHMHVRWSTILLHPPGLPVYARSGTAFESRLRHEVKRSKAQART